MKKINENFCGYIKVEEDIYTYYVSTNMVTMLPAESERQKRKEYFDRILSHNTDFSEYLYGRDSESEIAILRKGKFYYSLIGLDYSIRFSTPLIVKACGNAEGFFSMMTDSWKKFHAITFYGGNINALCDPSLAVEPLDIEKYLKSDGAKEIKIRPWSEYTRSIDFVIENEKVNFTISIGQKADNNIENKNSYNLGKLDAFIRLSFENVQEFGMIEKCYVFVRKLVAILTSQNNVCFEDVYVSQRNTEKKFFKTGECKIFDRYENYSKRQSHNVIPIFTVVDYIPNLIEGIISGKVDTLLEILPEDNNMVSRISIKNVQDMCTALEVAYNMNEKRKREKDLLIEELKKNIKKTIEEFAKNHNEIDVNQETTLSSAFQYLDYTLKQKILTLCNENSDIVNTVVSKNSLPQVDEHSVASFTKLRNNKTHSGTVEWGASADIYTALFAVVYANFFKYIEMPDEVIKYTLSYIF